MAGCKIVGGRDSRCTRKEDQKTFEAMIEYDAQLRARKHSSEQADGQISNLDITDEKIFDKAIIISELKNYMTDLEMVYLPNHSLAR